ncbi:MAG: TonB-dependent receptor [Pseudomonadota bacterium]
MHPPLRFNRNLLSSCIAALALANAGAAHGQDVAEEIVVTGVRAAQERAIDIKRNSAEVVDSISAEDIGKLPDTTISDSLQRVTGVQISRSAGQGGIISIRGSGEVLTTMNGELFLTAENILDSKANYQDVPSSLIAGSNVYKSMSAKQLEGGIGGSVDLLTRKSLTLDEGLNTSARVQASTGSITETTDPELSAFVGYNWGDQTAMSLALSYGDQTLSDNEIKTKAGDNVQDEASWGGNYDANGDGDQNDRFLIMSNWDGPRLYKNITERERLGLAYNFNSKIGDAFELNFDSFYNSMDEKAAGNYVHLGDETVGYNRANITKLYGITPVGQEDLYAQFYTTGTEKLMDGAIRGGVQSDFRETSAHNNSLELKYDMGGAFTGSIRYVNSKASRSTDKLTLAQKADSPGGDAGLVYNAAGATRVVNPGFISTRYPVSFMSSADDVSVNFDPALATALADSNAWYFHSSWLEGEQHQVNLDVLRADGNFKLADTGITSIDFGIRKSERTASRNDFQYFMDTGLTAYDPDNNNTEYQMLNKYHEAGYTPNFIPQGALSNYRVQVGATKNPLTDPTINFEPVRGVNLDESQVVSYLHRVNDFGDGVSAFNASIPMVDTTKINNNLSFMNMLYDTKHIRYSRPQASYEIVESRDAFYLNANFESDLSDTVKLTGNAGVRRVTDTVAVHRNITDSDKAPNILAGSDYVHTILLDKGDKVDYVDHSYFLPSANLNFAFADTYKIKVSYDERTSMQPLNNYGEGGTTGFQSQQVDAIDGHAYQPIGEVRDGGNPNLKPWKTSVYNLGFEMYPNDSTLLGLTLFYMDISGFSDELSEQVAYPDSDGIVRNGGTHKTLIDGKNAIIEGAEFSYQQSFDFLPGLLSHTGMTWNYTYSPSEKKGQKLAFDNSTIPFNNTAKNQSNLVLWFDNDVIELRLAANYLGKKYNGQYTNWTTDPLQNDNEAGLLGGLDKWEDSTLYVDASGTYHITENFDVNLNIQNLTEESNRKYLRWENFRSEYYNFERRITLGVNAKF